METIHEGLVDYVRDVPMEIGQRFFPPPTISLPTVTIPPLLNHPQFKPREPPSTLGSTDDLDMMAIKQPIEANTC
uniref:Ovule protein n=1 Tax=Heterorhabditis bacteriophora TaxID=37862 RepID=A0A1I7WY76_HETBA